MMTMKVKNAKRIETGIGETTEIEGEMKVNAIGMVTEGIERIETTTMVEETGMIETTMMTEGNVETGMTMMTMMTNIDNLK